MMRRASILIALVAGLTALPATFATTQGAHAAQSPAVADCNSHNRLTRKYSVAELRNALATMAADVKEYTDCYDVIQRALLAQVGSLRPGAGATSSQSGGGSFLPTPLIVVLAVLLVASAGLGVIAIRRRA